MKDGAPGAASPGDKTLFIVDADRAFANCLSRALEARGFEVTAVHSLGEAQSAIRAAPPAFAVVDIRLEDGCGLDALALLMQARPGARAIVLTCYGAIASAVAAVKLGASDYLAKPASADEILAALFAAPDRRTPPPENPMSAGRVRWEHIQRIYELCGRNISETARRLKMHRRTLQRILAKRAPK